MEEKVVCYYCATVYSADQGKCPLCGSTKISEDFVIPQRRERISEDRRKSGQKGGRYIANKKPARAEEESKNKKPLLVGALVFLILAVAILAWFIADMVGWIPGLENRVDRETQPPAVSVNVDCTQLIAEPTSMSFGALGQGQDLRISVNATCEELLYCTSNDPAVVSVSEEARTEEGTEFKSATFTVSAVGEGNTVITITCGNQTIGVPVAVTNDGVTDDPTNGSVDFKPELNRQELRFTAVEETVQLKVTNLSENATVIWMSGDEAVATVDETGTVTAVGAGETIITCDVDGVVVQISVLCDIEEETKNDEGAHLESTDVTVRVGDTFPLFLYNNKSEHIDDITYVVDDASICEVNDNYVKALSSGTTKVRVIYGDQEFVCIVRVR